MNPVLGLSISVFVTLAGIILAILIDFRTGALIATAGAVGGYFFGRRVNEYVRTSHASLEGSQATTAPQGRATD